MSKLVISFDLPYMQVNFANNLARIRDLYLQDALSAAVASVNVRQIDTELYDFADRDCLQLLALHGLRGELLFAIPCILRRDPHLLGYYRLLLGYSQKEFYTRATGAGVFKSLEEKGTISKKQDALLPDLCNALNVNCQFLLEQLDPKVISSSFFDDLTLLTLGPQLRGGANVQRGSTAIAQVFDIVYKIVASSVTQTTSHRITLTNKSGRTVYIQFSSDPDIVIREELAAERFRNLVAIEVKGGQDYSNIHNRIGEAEKSHQKAKKNGYIECWTVVNVDRVDMAMAHKESPTTNKFYRISALADPTSSEYKDFSLQILSIVGI